MKTKPNAVRCAIALLALAALAGVALAEGRNPVLAEELFRQGRQAMGRKDYETACAKLAESHRLDPAAGTVLNLAGCEEKQGKLASAWQHYLEAADLLEADDKRAPIARRRAQVLAERVPHLLIRLEAGAPKETKVKLDGSELGDASLYTRLPTNPGTHTLVVIAPRREDRQYTVELVEGKNEEAILAPGAALPAEKPPEMEEPTPRPRKRRAPHPPVENAAAPTGHGALWAPGFVLLGVGIAGLIAGGVTSALLSNYQSIVSSPQHCPSPMSCDMEGASAAQSGRSLTPVSIAAWSVGGAGVVLGTLFVILGRSRGIPEARPATDENSKAPEPSTRLIPQFGPGGAGLSLEGSF